MTPEVVPLEEAARRLRALSSGGIGPGLPRRRRDQWILLFSAARELPAGALDERSLNEMLKAWLAGLGPRVDLDHVSLRRALVDAGFVERTSDGARYARSRSFERHVVFSSGEEVMTGSLAEEKCTACHADAPKLTAAEIAEFRHQIPSWNVHEVDGVPRLERVFSFPDFARALAFTNKVGEIAEAEGHHPALLTEWGKVTVSWWTHKIQGLHRNDFVMAARTDSLVS